MRSLHLRERGALPSALRVSSSARFHASEYGRSRDSNARPPKKQPSCLTARPRRSVFQVFNVVLRLSLSLSLCAFSIFARSTFLRVRHFCAFHIFVSLLFCGCLPGGNTQHNTLAEWLRGWTSNRRVAGSNPLNPSVKPTLILGWLCRSIGGGVGPRRNSVWNLE